MSTVGMTSLYITGVDGTRSERSHASVVSTALQAKLESELLEEALDALRSAKQLLFGKYVVLGSCERRSGGQGCVQFVHDANVPTLSYAIKFFFNTAAFETERTLYSWSELGNVMAATHEIGDNADGRHTAPGGYRFPPYIVIERGEPLDEWMRRLRPVHGNLEITAAFQALLDVAQRLLAVHDAGYVHGDLKPSNILWLAQPHAWTLIDFGSAALTGECFMSFACFVVAG
jgi:serine/threonine protein kinase